MSTETPKIHLRKVEPKDLVTWREFNENCDILDGAIQDLKDGQATITQVSARQDTLDANQALMAQRLNANGLSIASLNTQVTTIQTELAEKASQEDLEQLADRVTALENDVVEIDGAITDIQGALTEQAAQNDAFAQKDQDLRSAIDAIETGLADMASKEDLEDRATQAENTSKEYADGELARKVDKVTGKGLSSNDYDDEAKAKVDKINGENGRFTYDGKDFYTKSESDSTFIAIADYLDQRSLTFIGSNRTQQYPWAGQVQLIQVNYTEERTSDINFWVEKQSRADFEAKLNTWQKIGGQILNLPLDKVYMEYAVTGAIAAGDMVRLSMPDDDPDITVQVRVLNDNIYLGGD